MPLRRPTLALLLISPALLVVTFAVALSLIALSHLEPGTQASAQAGLARVGEDLALVIVTDEGGSDTAGTRDLVVKWGVVGPVVALAPAAVVAWLLAGRVSRMANSAQTEVTTAGEERQRRLEEVVHELRTPLAVMGANLELAADQTDSSAAGYIEAARRAADRMTRTVDDLAGHGRLAVEHDGGPIDLASVAEAVAAEHIGPGRARGVHVMLKGAASVTIPAADPAAIRTAAGNFLNNAVRLAPRGSAIVIDWGEHGCWAWLAVTDEGPGLAPHLHVRAFERGWRGPHDRDRSEMSGTAGLGLTIARQLTEAQGGVVTVESEEGGGATFSLWIPLGPEADPRAVVAPDGIHPEAQPWRSSTVTT